MNYILTCSCHNQDKKAKEAFSMLYPDRELPTIIKGRDRIFKLSQSLNNEHIKAISKLSGKFAYYIEIESDKIILEYDLLKGKKIA